MLVHVAGHTLAVDVFMSVVFMYRGAVPGGALRVVWVRVKFGALCRVCVMVYTVVYLA